MSLTTPPAESPSGMCRVQTQPMFHRVFAASPMTIRNVLLDVRARFRSHMDDDGLGRLELVLAEVMNNLAEHGALPRPRAADGVPAKADGPECPSVHLCIVCHNEGVACAITDDGVSLPAACLTPRDVPTAGDDGLPEGGFGWCMIHDLTQALCYYREEQRNFLAFCVPFVAAPTRLPM